MDEKKKISLAVVIINCFCAVVWCLNVVLDLVYGYTSSISFVLHIVCTIVWTICAIIWLVQYVKQKKQNNGEKQ